MPELSQPVTITEADVEAFGQRLLAWAQGLSSSDQAIVATLFDRVTVTDEAETRGFTLPITEPMGDPGSKAGILYKLRPVGSTLCVTLIPVGPRPQTSH